MDRPGTLRLRMLNVDRLCVVCLLCALLVLPVPTLSQSWTSVPVFNTARSALAAATGPDGKIYAIGGQDNHGNLSSVEAYNPSTNTCTLVASMNIARYDLAATTGPDGKLYAIGGQDPYGNCLNVVESRFIEILPLHLTVSTSPPYAFFITLGAPAPDTGLLLTLSSSDPAAATLPTTLFIPPGATGGGAPITFGTTPDPNVTLSATYQSKVVSGSFVVNPDPTLDSVSPNPILAGGPTFTLTLNGTGFVPSSQVLWAGKKRATTFVSSTQLQATILASDIAKAGTQKVMVTNSSAIGGGKSNSLNVSVMSAILQQVGHQVTRNADGSVSVAVQLSNTGTAAAVSTQLTSAMLGSGSGTPLPQSLGTIGVGGTVTVTTTYSNPGTKGTKLTLTLSGSDTEGSWKVALSLVLP